MKAIRLTIVSTFISILAANSQYKIKSLSDLANLKSVPQEKMFVHHSSSVLFPGEYLFYKLYCMNAATNRLSNISKIGYLALVNEKGEYVIEHKVKLEKGIGIGDFFVQTTIPSGNYKLLGYTQWMKNSGINQVYKADITIINPYRADQSRILKNKIEDATEETVMPLLLANDTATIGISLNKKIFGQRDSVSLTLKNYKGKLGYGNYSIFVKSRDSLQFASTATTAHGYWINYLNADKQIPNQVGDSVFLPEQRGELFYGKVVNGLSGTPLANKPVVFSVPGKPYILKSARTDELGYYYTYVSEDYNSSKAMIQVLDNETDYAVKVYRQPKLDMVGLEFGDFKLKKEHSKFIKERSIQNQIENQYFKVKPDSIVAFDDLNLFLGGTPEVVLLDDYRRFKTFKETLVEVVQFVGYRKNASGEDYIRIAQDFETFEEELNTLPSIVLMDGLFIRDHDMLKNYEASKIKKIFLLRDKVALAGDEYQGLLYVETFDGNYFNEHQADNGLVFQTDLPKKRKNYFIQSYAKGTNKYEHVPDYRNILLWEPEVSIDEDTQELNLQFFTSDVTGAFDIVLEGFATYGKPISVSKTIMVKSRL